MTDFMVKLQNSIPSVAPRQCCKSYNSKQLELTTQLLPDGLNWE